MTTSHIDSSSSSLPDLQDMHFLAPDGLSSLICDRGPFQTEI